MYPVSARFLDVVTGTHRAISRARVFTDRLVGASPVGGLELPILAGDVKMTSTQDVKWTLDLTVPGDYWELVQPYSGEIFIERGVDFGDGTNELVPLGYYRIDTSDQDAAPYGPVKLTGSDRIASMQQNRVLYPYPVPDGTTHRTIFERLVNGRVTPASAINTAGYAMLVRVAVPITWLGYDPDRVLVAGGQVVEDGTYDFLAKLADDQQCVLRFDESGSLVVDLRDRDPDQAPDYLIAPGVTGNLIRASRKTVRTGVYNIVSAHGSDPASPTGYALSYNNDPNSPLRWNGPFGPAPRYYASPFVRTGEQAASAAASILSRYTGLPETLGLWAVPNPAMRPLDIVAARVGGLPEKHLVDVVEIPLAGGAPVSIATRTTGTDVAPDSPPTPDPTPETGYTQAQRDQEKAYELTSTAENSTIAWWTQYRYIEDIADGRGYTAGIVGFTSGTADLEDMIVNYFLPVNASSPLSAFVSGLAACTVVGKGAGASAAAASNLGSAFISAFRTAADGDAGFRAAQRAYRQTVYWAPAYAAAIADGLGPLGRAIYYDTMINHGRGVANSMDGSFDDIRSRTTGAGTTTFGKITNGTSNSVSSADKLAVSTFSAPASGAVNTGHARAWVSAGTGAARMVLYADSAGAPGALLATSDALTVSNTTEALLDFAFPVGQRYSVVSGTSYWIGVMWQDPGAANFTISRDATAGGRQETSAVTYPTAPNPFGTPTAQAGPMDAYVDITTGVASETAWLTSFLSVRSAVLTAWGDNPADGRINMWNVLLATGNLTLTTPFSWSVYGDGYTMAVEPTPYSEGAPVPTEPGTPGAYTAPGPAANIGGAAGQNYVNLGIGYPPLGGSAAVHKDITQAQLAAGFTDPPYYYLDAGGMVVMSAALDGGRTSTNTKYPRVEYRELLQDGNAKAAWNPSSGRHYAKCRTAIVALPPSKPEVVVLQQHDASDDTVLLRVHDTRLTLQVKGVDKGTIVADGGIPRNTFIDYMIEIVDGVLKVYAGSLTTPVYTGNDFTGTTAGQYFKSGCYAQSWARSPGDSSSTRSGSGPTDSIADSPMTIRQDPSKFEIWHTGYAKPSRPALPGGGTGGGTPTPPPPTGGGGTTTAGDGTQTAVLLGWGPIIDGDEFDYVGPPGPKWGIYEGAGHDGNGRRVASAWSVNAGVLTCTGTSNGDTGGMAYERDTKYFRIEWRVRAYAVNPGDGGNPYHPVLILWPQSDRWPQDGEYDFYEVDIGDRDFGAYLHIPGNDGSAQEYASRPLDLQNWHNIAFEWSRTGIKGWVDGSQVFAYSGSYILAPGPMHPTIQLDNFYGSGGMQPGKFEAQWMRIYASPS